jgi:ABC-type transporter Mla subunit MlaD
MSSSSSSGLGELVALLGAANPLAAVAKSVGQFQQGVTHFLDTVDTFNDTLQQLNAVAARVNGLLDTVEEPLKAFVPQVTRTVKATDALLEQLRGPIDKVAPGLNRLAETLSAPALRDLPTDIGDFLAILSDLGRRLQPLTNMAEQAGSIFGFNPLGALIAQKKQPAPAADEPPTQATSRRPTRRTPPVKKTVAKKASPTKAAAKKR